MEDRVLWSFVMMTAWIADEIENTTQWGADVILKESR